MLGDTPNVTAGSTIADVSSIDNYDNTYNVITTLGTSVVALSHPGYIHS